MRKLHYPTDGREPVGAKGGAAPTKSVIGLVVQVESVQRCVVVSVLFSRFET